MKETTLTVIDADDDSEAGIAEFGPFSDAAAANEKFASMAREGLFSKVYEQEIGKPETAILVGGSWSYLAQMEYHNRDLPTAYDE